MRKTKLSIVTVSLCFLSLSALTGCNQSTNSDSVQTPKSTPTSSPSKSMLMPSNTESSNKISADTSAGKIECEAITPIEQLYLINQNLALIPNVHLNQTPESGHISELGGTGCQITNLSTNSNIEIEIVKLTNQSAMALRNEFRGNSELEPVQLADDITGYFNTFGSVGQTQFIFNDYWIAISSAEFASPIDSTTIASLVISGL